MARRGAHPIQFLASILGGIAVVIDPGDAQNYRLARRTVQWQGKQTIDPVAATEGLDHCFQCRNSDYRYSRWQMGAAITAGILGWPAQQQEATRHREQRQPRPAP